MGARRGCLVTIIVLVLLAAAVWFIGLPLVNRKAESLVEDMIRSVDTGGLAYGGIDIDAARGRIEIREVSFPLDGASVRAGRIALSVDPAELAAFGLGRSEGLSGAHLDIAQLVYADEAISFDLGAAVIVLDGVIDLNAPDRSVVRDISIDAVDTRLSDKESGLGLDAASLDLKVRGRISAATLEKDFDGILDDISYVDVDAKQGAIVPDERLMAQLGFFAVASPWIADVKNWSFESLQVQARSLENSLALDAFSLAAPLMEAKGTASIPRKDAKEIALELDVDTLNSQVRDELNPLLGMLGQSIPSGSFGLSFDWRGTGIPQMVFR